jgi:hypothetical protein
MVSAFESQSDLLSCSKAKFDPTLTWLIGIPRRSSLAQRVSPGFSTKLPINYVRFCFGRLLLRPLSRIAG